jgi:hypothetical protein
MFQGAGLNDELHISGITKYMFALYALENVPFTSRLF